MLTLQQLYYFQEVAKRQNVSKTAEELYVSQTTLSIMISKLEQHLGFQLFSRSGRTLCLNDAGKMYLEYVEDAFAALENGKSALNRFFGEENRTVTFCMTNSIVWADAIRQFNSRFPDYTIRQQNYSTDQFNNILNSASVDYAIAGLGDYHIENYDFVNLGADPLYLCVSKEHPLAKRQSISVEDLSGLPLISLPKSSPFRIFCDTFFQKHHITCNTVVECDYTLRKELIHANYGAALTTQTALQSHIMGKDNIFLPLEGDDSKRDLILVWSPRHRFSQAALDFKDFLIQYFHDTFGLE